MKASDPGVYLAAIGTAVPAHARDQSELVDFMIDAHGLGARDGRKLRQLYRLSRIERRHSCIPDYGRPCDQFEFFPGRRDLQPAPSTGRRMRLYTREAPRLAQRACEDLFDRPQAPPRHEVDHVFFVSCTGAFAPGPDVLLTDSLGLRPDVGRTLVGFQGCHAGLSALHLAGHFCRAHPKRSALVVCVELCTLHFQLEPTEDNLLANALFADGAAAALVTGADRPPSDRAFVLRESLTHLYPESTDAMTWTIGDAGFTLRLSRFIPRLLGPGVERLLTETFRRPVPELAADPIWAVHPGGTAILDGIERAFELPADRLAASRSVLRRFGNMSSPTILFVLREILENRERNGPGMAIAFGPGLTVEAIRLETTNGVTPC